MKKKLLFLVPLFLIFTQCKKDDDDTEIKSEMTRYYNGVLPSSNYPAFNESRVNLIE